MKELLNAMNEQNIQLSADKISSIMKESQEKFGLDAETADMLGMALLVAGNENIKEQIFSEICNMVK